MNKVGRLSNRLRLSKQIACNSRALNYTANLSVRHQKVFAAKFNSSAFQKRDIEPVFPEGSIYTKESELFRLVHFDPNETKTGNEHKELREFVNELFVRHRPSKHPFFAELKNAPKEVVTNPGFLNEFYFRYQAAMHATRVAVYFTPFLNEASLRQRKLAVLSDDDALDKRSHHRQLQDMFESFGATPKGEEHFGDLEDVRNAADPGTAAFIESVQTMYPRTSGAWCIAEVLSDDWLSALADSFKPFFPDCARAEYFDEVFTGHVEILHMLETIGLTELIIKRKPEILHQTMQDMAAMSVQLDGLWSNLQQLTRYPEKYLTK